jgi:hypothetical protein
MRVQVRRADIILRGVCAGLAGIVLLARAPGATGAPSFPAAQEVIERVLATAHQTDLASANLLIKLRIEQPGAAPPACEFRGMLRVSPDRLNLTIEQWTGSPMCWLIERFVLTTLFRERDHAGSLLPLFRFEVIGEKLVDDRPYYLVYGRALARQTEPTWVMGWVDYDRGLVADGTAHYAWGDINSVQEYASMAGTWVIVHQRVDAPRLGADIDITYSDFRFGSGSGAAPAGPGN